MTNRGSGGQSHGPKITQPVSCRHRISTHLWSTPNALFFLRHRLWEKRDPPSPRRPFIILHPTHHVLGRTQWVKEDRDTEKTLCVHLFTSQQALPVWAKPHVGYGGYIDKTGHNLAPKEVLVTKPHLHQGALIFFQAWDIPGSPNLIELTRINLCKEKETASAQKHPSDP